MTSFGNYATSIIALLKKHKFLSFLMIVFVFVSLLILGLSVNMQQSTKNTATKYDDTFGKKSFFYTGEALSDNIYYRYLEENNYEDFQKLLNFENKLINSDSFLYTEIIAQPLEIINYKMPDIFLLGYESGNSDYSIYEYNGNNIYATKAMEVSDSFFSEYTIEVSDGSAFSKEDYLYSDGKEIPLLLGSAYKDYFKVGDKLEGYYLFEKKTFVIKGFIKDQSFFYSRSDNNFVSCERYMFAPSLKVDNATKFSKLLLLQQMTGMISSALGYEQTSEIYNKYLQESGIEEWNLYIVNPNIESYSMLDTYSAMTKEVAHQFNIILALVLVFGCVAMILVICGMLKENQFIFGVSLLCGASFRNIALETIGYVGIILLIGDLVASFIIMFQNVELVAFLIMQATIILMAFISCTACVLYLKRMDISDIIGGKE